MATNSKQDDDKLDSLIAEYLSAFDRGEPIDRDVWLTRHPAYAEQLRTFFADLDRVRAYTVPLRSMLPEAGSPADALDTEHVLAAARQSDDALADYTIIGELARGGMGVVYHARQESLGRDVALKVVLADPRSTERFEVEKQAAASLEHPNIVPIYASGFFGPYRYYSMKLVDGPSFAEEMPRFRRDARAAVCLIVELARALQFAHQRGVIHRDIKPSNVLVDRSGRVYLTDFGLAKQVDADLDLTSPGVIAGTPRYMAPEQASGRSEVTTAVDVYGLGVILYQVLTGRTPFDGDSAFSVLKAIQEADPLAPSKIDHGIDRDLETICLRSLEKTPERRYASAADLADDLERWLGGEPILARQITAVERAIKWARRRPQVAALLAAVAAALVVGVAGIAWQWRDAERQRARAETALAKAKALESDARAAKDALERRVYANHVLLADRALQSSDMVEARDQLDRCPDPLRGWEWHHLQRRVWGESPVRIMAQPNATALVELAVSPNGKWLASVDTRGYLRVWGFEGRAVLRTKLSLEASATSLAFSPDSRRLAVSFYNQPVVVVDVGDEGKQEIRIDDVPVTDAIFGPTGDTLLTAGHPGRGTPFRVREWDVGTGRQVREVVGGMADHVNCLVMSPSGKTLAGGTQGGVVTLWDYKSGRRVQELKSAGAAVDLAFDVTGGRLAVAGRAGLVMYDFATGATLRAPFAGWGVSFTPEGERVVLAGPGDQTTVFDASNLERLLALDHHEDHVQSVVVTSDGHKIITGGRDRELYVLDGAPGEEPGRNRRHMHDALMAGAEIKGFVSNANGPLMRTSGAQGRVVVVVDSGHRVHAWERASNRYLGVWPSPQAVGEVAVGRGGDRVGVVDAEHDLWVWRPYRAADPATHLPAFENDRGDLNGGMSFADDGTVALNSGWHTTVWDPDRGVLLNTFRNPHYATIGGVISPDGRYIASTTQNHHVRIIHADTGEEHKILKGHQGQVSALAFSDDSRLIASGGFDKKINAWDVETGQSVARFLGHTDAILGIAFSADGARLATRGADDSIRIRSVPSGSGRVVIRGKVGAFQGLVFSDGGRLLHAVGPHDRGPQVKTWRVD